MPEENQSRGKNQNPPVEAPNKKKPIVIEKAKNSAARGLRSGKERSLQFRHQRMSVKIKLTLKNLGEGKYC